MKQITIYSLSTCLWCRKTKKYFEDRKIQFEAVDFDQQDEAGQQRMREDMKKAGFACSFPFIRIGESCVQGYDPDEFEKLMGK